MGTHTLGVKVKPTKDAVLMEMRLANGTGEKLSDLRIQNCVMTKMAKGFEQQTSENKVLKDPYAACRSSDGKRWIVTAWQGCHRTWANEKCPGFHSDPKFHDLEPGQKATLKGWLSFYEGTDVEAEFNRIEETGWRASARRGGSTAGYSLWRLIWREKRLAPGVKGPPPPGAGAALSA